MTVPPSCGYSLRSEISFNALFQSLLNLGVRQFAFILNNVKQSFVIKARVKRRLYREQIIQIVLLASPIGFFKVLYLRVIEAINKKRNVSFNVTSFSDLKLLGYKNSSSFMASLVSFLNQQQLKQEENV